MSLLDEELFRMAIVIVIFLVMVAVGMYFKKRIINSSNRYLNPGEFLPDDEIHSLRQVYFLIMMALCFVNVFYGLAFFDGIVFYLSVFEIFLSLYIAIQIDKSSLRNKIIVLLLIPYTSMDFILFNNAGYLMLMIEFVRILLFIYLIKFYFDNFMEYTNSNGLGVAIVLLFIIIFASFFITQAVERVNPLDSLVMVSNAFTSNGYNVMGSSIPGKINSIFLVWGGYIISGAGTATLTASILLKHFNTRIRRLEKIIEEGSDENG